MANQDNPPSSKPGTNGQRGHYVVVIEGPEPGERVEIREKPVVIGRKTPADWLLIKDPLISRIHCRLWVKGDELMVADLDSTNGTYLNGRLVMGSMVWPEGSRLEVGAHVLEHQRS